MKLLPDYCEECGLDFPEGDRGALSRKDNTTLVCSECGILQALRDYHAHSDNRRTQLED